jgi:hypothetical protein
MSTNEHGSAAIDDKMNEPTRNSHPPTRADYLPVKGNTSFRREAGKGK